MAPRAVASIPKKTGRMKPMAVRAMKERMAAGPIGAADADTEDKNELYPD